MGLKPFQKKAGIYRGKKNDICGQSLASCYFTVSEGSRGCNEGLKEAHKIDRDMSECVRKGILKKATPKFNT